MGGINTSAVYGLARGMVDARKFDMEEQAFNTDQAIRTQTLQNNQLEQPLRRRALEASVGAAEAEAARRPQVQAAQDEALAMNKRIAKLTLDEKEALAKDFTKAREGKQILTSALESFGTNGDPQVVADAIAKIYPERQGLKATKNPDGSITIGTQTLPAEIINAAGEKVSAADQLAMFASTRLDPVADWKERTLADRKLKGELAKKDADYERATEVADIGVRGKKAIADAAAEGARTRAKGKADADAKKAVDSKVSKVGLAVDKHLKTKDLGGGFGMGYANEDDAAINGTIRKEAEALIRNSYEPGEKPMDINDAVSVATDSSRTSMREYKGKATTAAAALAKKGIDPNDKSAMVKAIRAGDPDAIALVAAMKLATRRFGESIEPILLQSFPKPKK